MEGRTQIQREGKRSAHTELVLIRGGPRIAAPHVGSDCLVGRRPCGERSLLVAPPREGDDGDNQILGFGVGGERGTRREGRREREEQADL
jgi:hypothetical protein